MKPFHASQHATLTVRVQQEIERRILSGEMPSGTRLAETTLADGLGVSRGPVREAIRGLAQTGLVEVITNRGAVVRTLTLEEIQSLYELRGAIFAMACAALARRRTDEDLGALAGNLAAMHTVCEAGDVTEYYRLNIAFHNEIMERSGNRRAHEMYASIVKEMHLFRRRGLGLVPNIAESLAEHEAIVGAIAAGDPDEARIAAIRHIEHGFGRFRETLREDGED